jgi:hypothetical protein
LTYLQFLLKEASKKRQAEGKTAEKSRAGIIFVDFKLKIPEE